MIVSIVLFFLLFPLRHRFFALWVALALLTDIFLLRPLGLTALIFESVSLVVISLRFFLFSRKPLGPLEVT